MTILIIEDSSFTRKQLVRMLAGEGFEIWEACDGQEGLTVIQEQKPDCIILDLLMPNVDGLDVLQSLSETGSAIPTIVLSADIQDSTREKCMNLGAVTFLEKPVRQETLLETIQGLTCVK